MKIIKNKIIPFQGYACINLFGFLFTRASHLSEQTIRHESIHSEQMKEMLYIPFYIWYFIEYLIRGVKAIFNEDYTGSQAYRDICFEAEAYANQDALEYLTKRKRYA